jgi:hypothetical protein
MAQTPPCSASVSSYHSAVTPLFVKSCFRPLALAQLWRRTRPPLLGRGPSPSPGMPRDLWPSRRFVWTSYLGVGTAPARMRRSGNGVLESRPNSPTGRSALQLLQGFLPSTTRIAVVLGVGDVSLPEGRGHALLAVAGQAAHCHSRACGTRSTGSSLLHVWQGFIPSTTSMAVVRGTGTCIAPRFSFTHALQA